MNELQSLSQIFQNKIFRIPDYQRGYAWQNHQLQDFWEDIINLQKDRYHYTGLLSMKVMDKNESARIGNDDQWLIQSGFKAFHIVDGQQRMTTFMIMLNEIIELVCKLPENEGKSEEEIYLGFENVKDIRAKYICRKRPPDGIITSYMFGYENDNPSAEYLKHRILGEPYGGTIKETYYTKNLKYAKDFFADELKTYYNARGLEGISDLYKTLTLFLMFNIHEIEDDYDVFVAFETMNNRGKRLTNLELLKNRLIYLTTLYREDILDKTDEAALREQINKAWREVYYQLGRNENALLSDDEFLRAHWIMYFTYSRKKGDDYIKFLLRKFSHKNIFEDVFSISDEDVEEVAGPDFDEDDFDGEDEVEIPEPISGEFLHPTEIRDYVNSLNETAEYWYYTFYPMECPTLSEEEQVWLEKLNHIGMGYFRPMLTVSLIPRLEITKEQRLTFFKAVERFIFINFRMAMYQSSYKSSDYNRKTRELYKGNMTISEITVDLNGTTDANANDAVKVFLTRMNRRFISSDGFYSWRDLRYFLYEYEYSLASKYKLEKLSWALLTKVVKDKVTVEHILPQSPKKLYWRNNFRQFNDEEKKALASSLGNLLPLSQSINSSLQNDSFDDKKSRGYINGCHSEIEVSKEEVWDSQHIYNRGIKLLHFMEDRWNFKFESADQMDELLHIGFVNDGRDIPPELTDETALAADISDENDGSRAKVIAGLIHGWAAIKDDNGEINFDEAHSAQMYSRFTTDAMSALIPNSKLADSGWGTINHYFFEVVNNKGESVYMKLALSGENMSDEQAKVFERINEAFPSGNKKVDWKWRSPFRTNSIKISKDMDDEEIVQILNELYAELQEYEGELIKVLGK